MPLIRVLLCTYNASLPMYICCVALCKTSRLQLLVIATALFHHLQVFDGGLDWLSPSHSFLDESAAAAGQQAPEPPSNVLLNKLELEFGPELRAVFPVVLNVGVNGKVVLSGSPSDTNQLCPVGVIRLENGVLNLVATQFRLDRNHPNSLTFSCDGGLDPVLDLALTSAELRAMIQVGGCAGC